MDRIKQLYDGTQAKFNENKTNIYGLLELDSTKPERRAILEECKTNELAAMEEKIQQFDPVWKNLNNAYEQLANDIGDYGELLKDCELQVCCGLIERLAAMQEKLTNTRHAITDMDSQIDLMRIKIGEVNVEQASLDYVQQKDTIIAQFVELNKKG